MSTFHKAKQMFEDAINNHIDPRQTPADHDLHAGLLALTQALDRELSQLHREVSDLKQQISSLG